MKTNKKLLELNNFYEVVDQAAKKWGDKTALIFDASDEKYTYADVKQQALNYASTFTALGISAGDKIALMLPNVPAFPFSWLGAGLLGAVVVPLNYRYKAFDAHFQIEHSESKMIVTTNEQVEMLNKLRTEQNLVFELVTVDEKNSQADGFLPELLKKESTSYQYSQDIFPETLMNIQYTSGTTGKPKGCMLSQKYWINIGEKIAHKALIGINDQDIMLTSQPFYYMDPQWNVMASLVNGATLVVLDRFSPSVFWEKVRAYQVTFFYVLGNMPILLLKMPPSEKDKKHHVRFIGCSAIPKEFQKEIEARWGVPWYEVFGMTETGYDISMRINEQKKYAGTPALGRPSTDREVRIVDSEGNFVPRGELGEMVFRGKGMMDGYFKNQEATNKSFKNGWFHTGDTAYMDKDGIVYYGGRIKDMIRRSGENIAAAEIEEVILLNGNVKMAACAPVEDEIRGEEVKAYIVPISDHSDPLAFIEDLIEHCQKNLAAFKVPRYWEVREDLPVTPSERIAKHRLKEEVYDYYDAVKKTWIEAR